jgi:hypothetical protein
MAIQPGGVLQHIHKACLSIDGLKRRFSTFAKGVELGCRDPVEARVNIVESSVS